jgi:hypothetical protein
MTEKTTRAASRAKNVAIHVEKLKSILQAAQNSAQALFAEIDAGAKGQGGSRGHVGIPETEESG